ncbi:MAG: DUF1289 domain-containing protein [Bacteroidetes bacterium]|jgi:hypothetical protein|nr:DUF1289 domain-containing protein [Bacteroidota bacterium]MBT5528006.1 DUF1289 domain-containing protein [Cytophagia bacterium]MBT3802293.1 DUF1289 domain-containing protein [Bacteroidota bacterium]MBT4339601.1 DUF1289 domain-containing protein [Bacteroidota bacterium]MBT4728964.1 DUF1289 domain-containing protein [Bacteroidota bacterium]
MSEVKSPCINVCTYDENKICLGCKRSEEEIINWDIYTNQEKTIVIDNCMKRRSEEMDYYGGPLA